MFSFHRPKTYRSSQGCCICRAKSSSSRFTDSRRYEGDFRKCFRISDRRTGEICNACVLLVKRWHKLPPGSEKHWHHVVDARAGPGSKPARRNVNEDIYPKKYVRAKSHSKTKFEKEPTKFTHANTDSLDTYDGAGTIEPNVLPQRRCPSPCESDLSDGSIDSINNETESQHSSFVDPKYWKKTHVCCGIIYKGQYGEVIIDPALIRPCSGCRSGKSTPKSTSTSSPTTSPGRKVEHNPATRPTPALPRTDYDRNRYDLPIDLSFKTQPVLSKRENFHPISMAI